MVNVCRFLIQISNPSRYPVGIMQCQSNAMASDRPNGRLLWTVVGLWMLSFLGWQDTPAIIPAGMTVPNGWTVTKAEFNGDCLSWLWRWS